MSHCCLLKLYELVQLTQEQETFLKENSSVLAQSIEALQHSTLVLRDLDKSTLQRILGLKRSKTINVLPSDLTLLQTMKNYNMRSLIGVYMNLFKSSLNRYNCERALLNSWHLVQEIKSTSGVEEPTYRYAENLYRLSLQFCQENWKELMKLVWFREFVIAHSKIFDLPKVKEGSCNCKKWKACNYLSLYLEDGSRSIPTNIELKRTLKSISKSLKECLSIFNPKVFFDVTADGSPLGRIIMELRRDVVPKTAENFRALCTGEKGFGYKGSILDCVRPNLYCAGGDIINVGGKAKGRSIYEEKFADENFILKNIGPGVLSMDNEGPDTNDSCFFISFSSVTSELEHYDGKYVVFGKVVDGMDVVAKIEAFGSEPDGVTSKEIVIANCGQLS